MKKILLLSFVLFPTILHANKITIVCEAYQGKSLLTKDRKFVDDSLLGTETIVYDPKRSEDRATLTITDKTGGTDLVDLSVAHLSHGNTILFMETFPSGRTIRQYYFDDKTMILVRTNFMGATVMHARCKH